MLSVNPGFTGTLTAEYAFTTAPTREIDFEYDHNGLRTQTKVVENGITTIYDYTLHGKLITHLTKRVVDLDGVVTSEELHFFYDAQSRPAFVEYNGTKYRYIHNLQGDIVAIVDAAGNPVVEYKYDAWGKPIYEAGSLLSTLGNLNPFRYRGYVWDEETELYYLRSRYYNARIKRFVNLDVIMLPYSLAGLNMYCYCRNNSVIFMDSSGSRHEMSSGGGAGKTRIDAVLVDTSSEYMKKVYYTSQKLDCYSTKYSTYHITFIPAEKVGEYVDSLSEDETNYGKGFLSASLDEIISGIVGFAIQEAAGPLMGTLAGIGFDTLVSTYNAEMTKKAKRHRVQVLDPAEYYMWKRQAKFIQKGWEKAFMNLKQITWYGIMQLGCK